MVNTTGTTQETNYKLGDTSNQTTSQDKIQNNPCTRLNILKNVRTKKAANQFLQKQHHSSTSCLQIV